MNVLTVISLLACLVSAGLLTVFWKLRPAGVCTQAPADWLDEFSIERYRPMLRLADDAKDLYWITAQTNLPATQAEQYRSQRCRILRGYLQEMSRDFERMTKAFDVVLEAQRPQWAPVMRRCQTSFSRELKTAHRQLALYARGVGSIELERLLAAFDNTHRELCRLRTHTVPVAA